MIGFYLLSYIAYYMADSNPWEKLLEKNQELMIRNILSEASKSVPVVSTVYGYTMGRADGYQMTEVDLENSQEDVSLTYLVSDPFKLGYQRGLKKEESLREDGSLDFNLEVSDTPKSSYSQNSKVSHTQD